MEICCKRLLGVEIRFLCEGESQMCGFLITVPQPILFFLLYFFYSVQTVKIKIWNITQINGDRKVTYIKVVCRENGWETPPSRMSLLALPSYFPTWLWMKLEESSSSDQNKLILITEGYGMKSAFWRTTLRFQSYQVIAKEAQQVVLPSCLLLLYGNYHTRPLSCPLSYATR